MSCICGTSTVLVIAQSELVKIAMYFDYTYNIQPNYIKIAKLWSEKNQGRILQKLQAKNFPTQILKFFMFSTVNIVFNILQQKLVYLRDKGSISPTSAQARGLEKSFIVCYLKIWDRNLKQCYSILHFLWLNPRPYGRVWLLCGDQ